MAQMNTTLPEGTVDALVDWFRETVKAKGGEGAVIGFDGGRNSVATLCLASKALGRDNVTAVILPDRNVKGVVPIKALTDTCKPYCDRFIVMATGTVRTSLTRTSIHEDGFKTGVGSFLTKNLSDPECYTRVNSHIRAQFIDSCLDMLDGRLVHVGIMSLTEDWLGIRYRMGGIRADIQPFARFTSSEIGQIGVELGASLSSMDIYRDYTEPETGLSDLDIDGIRLRSADRYVRGEACTAAGQAEKLEEMHRAAGPLRCENCFDPGLPIRE